METKKHRRGGLLDHKAEKTQLKTAIAGLLGLASTGCIVAGGYSSEGGWFIWPGTFVLLSITLVLFLLFRRRR